MRPHEGSLGSETGLGLLLEGMIEGCLEGQETHLNEGAIGLSVPVSGLWELKLQSQGGIGLDCKSVGLEIGPYVHFFGSVGLSKAQQKTWPFKNPRAHSFMLQGRKGGWGLGLGGKGVFSGRRKVVSMVSGAKASLIGFFFF